MKFEDCVNCKYFVRHYYINDILGVRELKCGHCRNLSASKRKRIKCCDLFEGKSEQEKRRIAEFNVLNKVNYKLDSICRFVAELNEESSNIEK